MLALLRYYAQEEDYLICKDIIANALQDAAQAMEGLEKIEQTLMFFKEYAQQYFQAENVRPNISFWAEQIAESLKLTDSAEAFKQVIKAYDRHEAQGILKEAMQVRIGSIANALVPFVRLRPAFNAHGNQKVIIVGSDLTKVKQELRQLAQNQQVHHAVQCGGKRFLAVLCETKLSNSALLLTSKGDHHEKN